MRSRSRVNSRKRPFAIPARPALELLEDRAVPSVAPLLDSVGRPASYPVGIEPRAMVSADFDGDQRLDLAIANYGSNSVSVWLGNADGSFRQAPDHEFAT